MRFKKLNNNKFFILLQFFISVVFLLPYFWGKQILFGEGQYYLSWVTFLEKIGNTWADIGLGMPTSQGIGNTFPVIYIWNLFEKIGISFNIIQFIWFFLLFFLPFLFTFLLLTRILKIRPLEAFILSSFYIYNPIFLSNWLNVNPWSMLIYYMIPLVWFVIGKFWTDAKKLFAYSFLGFFFSVYICANPPYTVVLIINIFLAVLFFSFFYNNRICTKLILKNALVALTAFIIASNFVIINTIIGFRESIATYINTVDPTDILKQNSIFSHLDRVFIFRHLFFDERTFSFLHEIVNFPLLFPFLVIPFLIVVGGLFIENKRKSLVFILVCIAVTLMLIKGINAPFGIVFAYMFKYVPLFFMFKTAPEKFSPLYLFLITICLGLILRAISFRNKRLTLISLSLFVVIFFIPVASFHLVPNIYYLDSKINHFQGRSFFNKSVDKLNQKKLVSNVISLPGSKSYLVLVKMNDGSGYLGLDPITSNIYQGNVEAFTYSPVSNFLYESLLNGKYQNVLSLFNVKYVILNKNTLEGFGFMYGADSSAYEDVLGKEMSYENVGGAVNIYDNTLFTPHTYAPKNIFIFERDFDNLSRISGDMSLSDHSAIIFEKDIANNAKIIDQIKNLDLYNGPSIEFRKVNSAKFVVKIHKAKSDFPLVISDSFNDKWKLYFSNSNGNDLSKNRLEKYSIISGNENEQATKEEVSDFIKKGIVTSLGSVRANKGALASPGFISKNYGGTIQNDNLQSGHFYDVIFKKPAIDESSHFMANGYANGWIISPEKLCQENAGCVKNKDGSYDFEIVSEFYPQKYYYLGVFISCFVFLLSVIFLTIDKLKGSKGNNLHRRLFCTHFDSVAGTLKRISWGYRDRKEFCDLGCGRGERTVLFKEDGRRIIGIDYDDPNSKYFKEFDFKKENIFKNSLLPESFDIVFSYDVIEHLDHPEKLIEESYRLLRKKGVCVIATPNKYRLFGFILIMLGKRKFPFCLDEKRKDEYPEFWHLREYTSGELKKILQDNGFQVRKVYKLFYGKPSSWGIRSLFGLPFYHNIIVVAEKKQ
jgi:2-polyprenyl-3-methyl-5-hydroxy-6-metoxy-1,4-benzoquinol methylase